MTNPMTASDSLVELLPCPFCGTPLWGDFTWSGHQETDVGAATCFRCGAQGPTARYEDISAAFALWNTRAALADLTSPGVTAEEVARIIHPIAWSSPHPYRTPLGDQRDADARALSLAKARAILALFLPVPSSSPVGSGEEMAGKDLV